MLTFCVLRLARHIISKVCISARAKICSSGYTKSTSIVSMLRPLISLERSNTKTCVPHGFCVGDFGWPLFRGREKENAEYNTRIRFNIIDRQERSPSVCLSFHNVISGQGPQVTNILFLRCQPQHHQLQVSSLQSKIKMLEMRPRSL